MPLRLMWTTSASVWVEPPATSVVRSGGARECHVAAEAVVERAGDQPVVRQVERLGGDHHLVALVDAPARFVGVAPAHVHVQLLQLDRFLALIALEDVDRLAPAPAPGRPPA